MNQMIHMEQVNKSYPEEITAEKGLPENWIEWCNTQRGSGGSFCRALRTQSEEVCLLNTWLLDSLVSSPKDLTFSKIAVCPTPVEVPAHIFSSVF